MKPKRLRWLWPWLLGALAATALFALLALIGELRYENSDDSLFVKAFMGFEGQPADFTLYTHTLLALALRALSAAVPGVAWFSVFQLALLWLSCAVIFASLMQHAARVGLRAVWGALAAVVYLGVFAAFACARLTYTTTAALAGAAAAVRLFSLDTKSAGAVYRGSALALFLLACCYSLRQIAVLPPLAYVLLAFAWQLWRAHDAEKAAWLVGRERHSPAGLRGGAGDVGRCSCSLNRCGGAFRRFKPLLISLCAILLTLGALAGVRELELNARGQREYLRWQTARIELFDYTPFEGDIAPALAADSGLTASQLELVQKWYFMDADIDAQALQALSSAYADVPRDSVLAKLAGFVRSNPRYALSLALAVLLCLMGAICACGHPSRGGKDAQDAPQPASAADLPTLLASLLALAGGAAMLVYLSLRGRVLFRAVDSVLFPCAGALLALALTALGTAAANGRAPQAPSVWKPARRLIALILCAACLAVSGANVLLTRRALSGAQDSVSLQRQSELEGYALDHPDTLILRSTDLLRDTRLLPDVSLGMPTNLMIWGDWYCRTPSWNAQLARFGFDVSAFAADSWLSPRILYVTAGDEPPQALCAHIAEVAGCPVRAVLADERGVLRYYRFQRQ